MTTITTAARSAPTSAFTRLIMRHPLVAYFGLAFAGFWGVQLPMLLSQDGFGLLPYTVPMLPATLLFVLSVWAGPALAALAVTAVEGGRAGVYAHLRRCVRWRVGLRWYLVVLLGYPLLYILAGAVLMGAAALQAVGENWALLITAYLPALVLSQGITQWAEEPGWRGFALPRLEERFGPVRGSLLLGLLHGLWHLPVFVYSGGPVPLGPFDPAMFALNTALVAVMTIMWSWVYNNTGGSILLAVLLHSSFNASGSLIGQLIPNYPDAAVYLANGAFVLIPLLLVVLTRGRLGAAPDRSPSADLASDGS